MKTLNKIAEEGNKNFTILIAEDNKLQSQILEELITPSGYKVIKAFDGEETLEKAFRNLHEVTRNSNTDKSENHFGPDLVQAFLNIENEFIKIKKISNI